MKAEEFYKQRSNSIRELWVLSPKQIEYIALIMEEYAALRQPPVIGSSSLDKLAKECMKHVKCDTARISKPCDKMYLIIGFNRNTKDDEGVWVNQDNERIDFDYVQESVVASGYTKKELIESAKEYQRLCGITWEQYFQELAQMNCR